MPLFGLCPANVFLLLSVLVCAVPWAIVGHALSVFVHFRAVRTSTSPMVEPSGKLSKHVGTYWCIVNCTNMHGHFDTCLWLYTLACTLNKAHNSGFSPSWFKKLKWETWRSCFWFFRSWLPCLLVFIPFSYLYSHVNCFFCWRLLWPLWLQNCYDHWPHRRHFPGVLTDLQESGRGMLSSLTTLWPFLFYRWCRCWCACFLVVFSLSLSLSLSLCFLVANPCATLLSPLKGLQRLQFCWLQPSRVTPTVASRQSVWPSHRKGR